jgi:outer membrane biosynthesis protein TonB
MTRWIAPVTVLAMLFSLAASAEAQLEPTAARLLAGAPVPLAPPLLIGGGEVVLDLTVGTDGSVMRIDAIRSTPSYTELMTGAVRAWRFEAAKGSVKGVVQPIEGHALVLAVFRPPDVYSAPARGVPTTITGEPSAELPRVGVLEKPLMYPPRAVRDGTVLIEVELTAAAVARGHRVMSPPSAFDGAALETVKSWRFDYPLQPTGASQLFVYAVVGFREPITP